MHIFVAPYCNNLFASFQANTRLSILWNQLKPLVRGKLLYAPDTVATRRIVKEVDVF